MPPHDATPPMPEDLLAHALRAKGFMPEDEGALLYGVALERLPHGPALEVGTYCGKSAVYLGAAARAVGNPVLRGPSEHSLACGALARWQLDGAPYLIVVTSGMVDEFRGAPNRVNVPGRIQHVKFTFMSQVKLNMCSDSSTVLPSEPPRSSGITTIPGVLNAQLGVASLTRLVIASEADSRPGQLYSPSSAE